MRPRRADRLRVLAVCLALLAIPASTLVACSGRQAPGEPFDCAAGARPLTIVASTGPVAP